MQNTNAFLTEIYHFNNFANDAYDALHRGLDSRVLLQIPEKEAVTKSVGQTRAANLF